jgi:hypothetical protein
MHDLRSDPAIVARLAFPPPLPSNALHEGAAHEPERNPEESGEEVGHGATLRNTYVDHGIVNDHRAPQLHPRSQRTRTSRTER